MRTAPSFDYMKDPKWWIIDAAGQCIGRVATTVAHMLRGKHNVDYTPHIISRDKIVIINVSEAIFTGKKSEQKVYYRHTGYFGGLKELSMTQLNRKDGTRALYKAIERMVHSRTPLGKRILRNLYLYENAEHSHTQVLHTVNENIARNNIFGVKND